jgi:3-(methylthio)propionyl---CoA ligase
MTHMLPGLMQDFQLSTTSIISYAAQAHGQREVVSRMMDGSIARLDYAIIYARCQRAANMLRRLGVKPGDRVASLAWNTHRHLELFYAVPGIGAVLHTVNPRLFEPQIEYIINHGGAEIVLLDGDLAPLAAALASRLGSVRRFILLSAPPAGGDTPPSCLDYEKLLEVEEPTFAWPDVEENSAACLCYTSGTSGTPKGVLYSHRSTVLHAMGCSLNAAFGYFAHDCVLPAASLYHGAAWAAPFTAPLNGAKLVLPANRLDGESLHAMFEQEEVTVSSGVPTIWTNYLGYLERSGVGPTTLKRINVGGSALPISLAETFAEKYGVTMIQSWGMTETSPMGVVSTPAPTLDRLPQSDRQHILWTKQGRLQFGIEIRTVDDNGDLVPRDGVTPGALQVRGPWVIRRYFRDETDVVDADGWLDCGDVGTIDEFGFLRLTDRRKDLIKSGGEWISSIDLENAAQGCEGILRAAVIGIAHPIWEERPLLIVELQDGAVLEEQTIFRFLKDQVARWWLPDDVVFGKIPLTATGKIDKKQLRQEYAGYQFSSVRDDAAAQRESSSN